MSKTFLIPVSSGFKHTTGYSSKKPQTPGIDWLNRLPPSFISPLIFCLHSSLSCQCSLFRFYARQYSCIPPSQPTSEKIIGDRFAGRTFPQLKSQALSGKWLRLTECFTLNSSKENIPMLLKVCTFTFFSTRLDPRGAQDHLAGDCSKDFLFFSPFWKFVWCNMPVFLKAIYVLFFLAYLLRVGLFTTNVNRPGQYFSQY